MAPLNIFDALLLLQEKHSDYFMEMQTNIMYYIDISWKPPIRVEIKNEDMSPKLRKDIEELLLPLNDG